MKSYSKLNEKKSLSNNTIDLVDEVIAIQLDKIEQYKKASKNDIINEKSEAAMGNMIELLKLRASVANRINLFK